MPALKEKKIKSEDNSPVFEYRGKRTRTGNSSGFRFEGAFFKSHPEFGSEVRAHVIAPGRMLVTAEVGDLRREEDPVMASFLAFLANDMVKHPERIEPLRADRVKRIERLTKGVATDPHADLGQDVLL